MRRVFIVFLLASLLVLSGCSRWNPDPSPNPEHEQYYQGSQGVMMRFVPGSPPPRAFYYSGEGYDDNIIDVSVELHNEGASDTIGALYISGYSPEIIEVEGTDRVNTGGVSDCVVGLGGGSGGLGVNFHCKGGGAELRGVFDGNGFAGSADGLLSFLGLENVGDHIDITSTGDNWQFNFGWNMFQNTGALNHGRMLVILLSQLNFHRYNGYPFSGGVDLDANPSGVLRGDNYYHPGGDYGFQNFQAHVVSWPQGLDRYDATWQVDACYAYSTYAAPSICVDPAPYDDRDKVCHPREYTWSGSQGAPVAITSLKQDSTPRKMILTFTIRNVGQGEVFHPGYMERCSPYYPGRFDARYKDIVYIGDIRIGGGTPDNPSGRLTCTPGYKVRLRDGVGTFTCEYNLQYAGSRNAYETPVVVELWYGYHETIKTHTLIKRAG